MAGNKLKGFLKDRSGNVAIMMGIFAIPLFAAVGIAVDYSRIYQTRTDMQNLADSAALAGALADPSKEVTNAENFFAAGNVWGIDPDIKFENSRVTVEATYDLPVSILGLLDKNATPISVASVAGRDTVSGVATGGPNSACIYVLDPVANGAFDVTSSGTFSSDCGIQVNSNNSRAFTGTSSGTLTLPEVSVVGSSSFVSSGSATVNVKNNQSPVADPLASLPEPAQKAAPCDHVSATTVSSGSATLQPGVYCGGLTITSSGNLTMEPGIYVFRDGPLKIAKSGKMTANGVMFYFEDDASYASIASSGNTEISAPDSGPFKGILVYQGRDSRSPDARYKVTVSGNNEYNGTFYVPNAPLNFTFSGKNNFPHHTPMIANTLKFTLSGTNSISNDEKTGGPVADVVSKSGASGGKVRLLN